MGVNRYCCCIIIFFKQYFLSFGELGQGDTLPRRAPTLIQPLAGQAKGLSCLLTDAFIVTSLLL